MMTLLFLLECVKVFLMVSIGGFLAIALTIILALVLGRILNIAIYILVKLFEYEMDWSLDDEDEPEAPDYIEAPDGEKIIYDEDTQE